MGHESVMNTKKINPLTIQSKQWLLDALLQLMKEKKYNEITIKELTERAGLDRKTFYRHFKAKDEILNIPIKEAFDKYIYNLRNLPMLSSHEANKAYFELCLQYIDFFKLLESHGMLMIVLVKLSEYLPIINGMFLDDPVYSQKTAWGLTYEAGGIWNVTVRWISSGAKESPEEMAKMIDSIMPPIFQE